MALTGSFAGFATRKESRSAGSFAKTQRGSPSCSTTTCCASRATALLAQKSSVQVRAQPASTCRLP